MRTTTSPVTGAGLAEHIEAMLQLKACFWRATVQPWQGSLQAPAPGELAEFTAGGTDWFKGIYPGDAEMVRTAVGRVAQGLESEPLEYRMVVENGGITWVRHWFLDAPEAPEGGVTGYVQVLDERKRLEAECLRAPSSR